MKMVVWALLVNGRDAIRERRLERRDCRGAPHRHHVGDVGDGEGDRSVPCNPAPLLHLHDDWWLGSKYRKWQTAVNNCMDLDQLLCYTWSLLTYEDIAR